MARQTTSPRRRRSYGTTRTQPGVLDPFLPFRCEEHCGEVLEATSSTKVCTCHVRRITVEDIADRLGSAAFLAEPKGITTTVGNAW